VQRTSLAASLYPDEHWIEQTGLRLDNGPDAAFWQEIFVAR
jgi:hypothetical protein